MKRAANEMIEENRGRLPAKQTLLLILLPMLGTFVCSRLYLHIAGVTHIYPGGVLVHHLFFGVAVALPAAFVLACAGVGARC